MNDVGSGTSSDLIKFAGDTNIGKIIGSRSDVNALQEDPRKRNEWAVKWLMKFNVRKCSVINLGRENPYNRYTVYF